MDGWARVMSRAEGDEQAMANCKRNEEEEHLLRPECPGFSLGRALRRALVQRVSHDCQQEMRHHRCYGASSHDDGRVFR